MAIVHPKRLQQLLEAFSNRSTPTPATREPKGAIPGTRLRLRVVTGSRQRQPALPQQRQPRATRQITDSNDPLSIGAEAPSPPPALLPSQPRPSQTNILRVELPGELPVF